MNKQWSESPFVANKVLVLSAEARDLLDKIFVVDPAKRITIAQIMQHPWCGPPKPLIRASHVALDLTEDMVADVTVSHIVSGAASVSTSERPKTLSGAPAPSSAAAQCHPGLNQTVVLMRTTP